MKETPSRSGLIARNSLMLYVRMLLVMCVSLYTSRVVLRVLGVEDYGIYNVVAGVVTMLSFLTNPLSGTASRYITVALGRGDRAYLFRIFGTTRMVQRLLAAAVLLLAETAGLWLVCAKLVIPPDRFTAALFIYHFSVLICVVSLLSVPYNALIIAHERMSAFAYISLFEVVAKLAVAFSIEHAAADRLVVYGALLLALQLFVRGIYVFYCRGHFSESRAPLCRERGLLRELFSYSSWCFLGYVAIAGYTQGLNVLLNLFFGPVVNAARAIAVQVQVAVGQLCANFFTAVKPQIVKSYASGELSYMNRLIVVGSKYSFFIMLLVVVPLAVNAPFVLQLWLGHVPAHTVSFVRLTLCVALIESLKDPLLAGLHATGRIRKFQVVEGALLLSILPVSYALLKFSAVPPEAVFAVYFAVEATTQCVRVRMILPRVGMSFAPYVREVVGPVLVVGAMVGAVAAFVPSAASFGAFVAAVGWQAVLIVLLVAALGATHDERRFVREKMQTLWLRCRRRIP